MAGDGAALRRYLAGLQAADHPTRDIDVWRIESLAATIALAEGRLPAARAHADHALAAGADSWNDTAMAMHIYIHAFANRLDGDPGRDLPRMAALADAVGGPIVRLLETWMQVDMGDLAQAAYVMSRVGEGRIAAMPEFFLGSMGLAAATGIAIALEDPHWMAVVRRAWEPIETQICGIAWAPLPAAGHYAGLLDRRMSNDSAARRAFALATDAHERFEAPGFEDYAQVVRAIDGPPYA